MAAADRSWIADAEDQRFYEVMGVSSRLEETRHGYQFLGSEQSESGSRPGPRRRPGPAEPPGPRSGPGSDCRRSERQSERQRQRQSERQRQLQRRRQPQRKPQRQSQPK